MTIPMFTNEDDHYEYERERFEGNYGYEWDDTLSDDMERWEREFDGYSDCE